MEARAVANEDVLVVIPMRPYTDMDFGSTGQYQAVSSILGAAPPGTQRLCIYEGSKHVSDYHLCGWPARFHFITHHVDIKKHVPAAPRCAPTAPAVVAPVNPTPDYDSSEVEDGIDPFDTLFD